MNNLCLLVISISLAACGGGSKVAAIDPGTGAGSAAIITEIPSAAGAVGTAGAMPPEVSSLPPSEPQAAAAQPEAAPTMAGGPVTTLVGQAWYAGPACDNATWPPSCNGPYRATWVWIWSHAAGQWLRSSQTDNDGRYTFYVEAGWYTIMVKTGFAEQWWYAKVNVPPAEVTTANLVVDFGAR